MNGTQIFPKKRLNWQSLAFGVVGWSLLLGSWILLWEGLPLILAPWLSGGKAAENELAREWPALSFILINLSLLANRLRAAGASWRALPWLFGATNTIFYLVSLALNGLSAFLAGLGQVQFPVENYQAGSMGVLVCLLAFNLFIFQSRVKMGPHGLSLNRWRSVGLLVGVETLLIGSIIWFPVIWAGLVWVDRLFYPYTPVLITGSSLVILLLIMLGTVVLNQPALAGEGTPSLEKSE